MNKNFKDSAVGKAFMLAINCLKETGHNQLCNREVEVDGGEIAKVIDSIFGGCHTDNEWEDRKAMTEAISKAISQGKVLKLTKEE